MQRSQIICAGILIALSTGCSQDTKIREYTVPKGDQPVSTTDDMRSRIARRGGGMQAASSQAALPDFQTPQGWQKAEQDQFSLVAFAAGPDERPARVTITATNAGSGIDAQLNRWRKQVGLPPADQDALAAGASALQMGETEALLVNYTGSDDDTILGAIAAHNGKMWFFKMRGPTQTVAELTEEMKSFCESVRFKGG